MQTRLKMSRDGLELLKEFEGLRLTAARLPDGRWTMGHGHTQHAREGATITEADAEALLIYDLIPVSAAVNEAVIPQISQNQFDALVCFAFNVGVEAFRESEVLRRVNQERMTEAALAMAIWRAGAFNGRRVVLDALVRRRTAEEALLLGGSAPSPSDLVRPEIDPDAEASLPGSPPAEVALVQTGEAVEARLVEAVITPEFPRETASPAQPLSQSVSVEPTETGEGETIGSESGEGVVPEQETQQAFDLAQPADETTPSIPHVSVSTQIYGNYSTQPFSPMHASSHEDVRSDEVEEEVAALDSDDDGPPLVLVLTPPPEIAVEPMAQAQVEDAPSVSTEDQAPLFEGSPGEADDIIFYEPEADDDNQPASWSDTGAYVATGAVGLAAFGFGIAGFHLAGQEPVPAGFFDEKTAISWVLVAIGVVCVWISAYNLFKRLGGPEAE